MIRMLIAVGLLLPAVARAEEPPPLSQTQIQATVSALADQRNQAMNALANAQGMIADLQERLKAEKEKAATPPAK